MEWWTRALFPSLLCVFGYLLFRLFPGAKGKGGKLSGERGIAISLSISPVHEFSKDVVEEITLIQGMGIQGDCHAGEEVQHRHRRTGGPPYPPNLRQVHLMQSELFDEFMQTGPDGKRYLVHPGDLGENITTRGLDLLGLSEGTRLHFLNSGPGSPAARDGLNGDKTNEKGEEEHAIVRVTGLRNPCYQINKFQKGLQERCVVRDENRKIVVRKAGIMGVVETGGVIKKGATILTEAPEVFKAMGEV